MNERFQKLCRDYKIQTAIDPRLYDKYNVKRGLRNNDGSGVVVGLTNICCVHGYVIDEGEKRPAPGQLIYRGYDICDLISGVERMEDTALRKRHIFFFSVIFPTRSILRTSRR